MDLTNIKTECLYFSTTLGLKFKFRNEGGNEDDFDSRTSVIVLDNNAIGITDGTINHKNKSVPSTLVTPRPVKLLTRDAIKSITPRSMVTTLSPKDGQSINNDHDTDDSNSNYYINMSNSNNNTNSNNNNEGNEESNNPFASLPVSPDPSMKYSNNVKSPKEEVNITKIIIECDELFGVGIKRLLRVESSLFNSESTSSSSLSSSMDEFVSRLIQCLKVYSLESTSMNENTANLYQKLWKILDSTHMLSELMKYMTVSYYDADVEDYVILVDDNDTWKEFSLEPKKRIKVILRSSVLAAISKSLIQSKEPIHSVMDDMKLEDNTSLNNTAVTFATVEIKNKNRNYHDDQEEEEVEDGGGDEDGGDDEEGGGETNSVVDNNGIDKIEHESSSKSTNWLDSNNFDSAATFMVDNDGDLIERVSESVSEEGDNDGNRNDDENGDHLSQNLLERMNSNTYVPQCPGVHWIKSPHHMPPIGALVLSVNGINISVLDRDFQLALLKQRRRPLLIGFGILSSSLSSKESKEEKIISIDSSATINDGTQRSNDTTPDKGSWHNVNSSEKTKNSELSVNTLINKPKIVIPFISIQSKYAYGSMSKVRKTVDNILKEYVACDWVAAIKDKTGTPQATIISLYKYVESEMVKLRIIITPKDGGTTPSKTRTPTNNTKNQPIEALEEETQNQVSNHIETLIYQRIAEHTLNRVAIPYHSYMHSQEISTSSGLQFSSLSLKLSFLRFVRIHQLGLQGLSDSIREISSEQLIEREEWRLVMKGLCRALQFNTPALILSKIVITIRLIIQALDALINRPEDSNQSIICRLQEPEHHHVDNIYSDEEYDALKLLIASHQKYPSATSTDVLMLQKVIPSTDKISSTSSTTIELSADEILPAIAWAVIQSNPNNIEAILWICSEFRHPQLLRGEEAYCLAQLTSAVEFVKRIDETMLDMSKEDYEREYKSYQLTQELFHHCRIGSSTKVIAPLIHKGADVNGLTQDQCDTPLTLSIRHEHHHLISYLVKQSNLRINKPISPCKGQYQNSIALLEAVRYNQIATVLKLLKNGGNRYHIDDNGYTALSIAREHDYHDIVMVLQADPYRINYLDAIEAQEVDLIRGLLLQGVDINMFLYDPSTAGSAAAQAGTGTGRKNYHPVSVDLMLTPLMAATGCNNLYIIRTIIDAESVDVDIVNQSDPYQDTALSYCLKRCCGLAPAHFIVKPLIDDDDDDDDDDENEDEGHRNHKSKQEDDEQEIFEAQAFHVLILSMLIQAGASKDVSITIDPSRGKSLKPLQLIHQAMLTQNDHDSDEEDTPMASVAMASVSGKNKTIGSSIYRGEDDHDEPFTVTPVAKSVSSDRTPSLSLSSEKSMDRNRIGYASTSFTANSSSTQSILSSNTNFTTSTISNTTEAVVPILEILEYYQMVDKVDNMITMRHPLRDISNLFLYDPAIHEIYDLARERNYHGVISLLRQGIDINKADPNKGYTSLIAATFNKDYLMLELVLRSQTVIAESSPLPDQAPGNIYTSVREPLKPPNFLDINRPGRGGMRALHYAAQVGDVKIIGRLLQAGADRYLRNKKGLTAFDVALMNNHVDAINLLRYDPTQISISIAAKHGDWNVIKSLLNQGVSVNATPLPSQEGSGSNVNISSSSSSTSTAPELYTPLIAAVAHGQLEVVKQLLQIPNIDVNLANLEGQTALMFASARGDEATILKLLHAGANRWLKDSKGKIAADWALAQQHELINVLLLHDPAEIYIHDVIRKGDFNATVAMFKQGINPNQMRYYLRPIDEAIALEAAAADNEETNPYDIISSGSKRPSATTTTTLTLGGIGSKQNDNQIRPRSPSQHNRFIEKYAANPQSPIQTDPKSNSNSSSSSSSNNSKNNGIGTGTGEDLFIPGETPLCIACYYGRHDTVRLLLKAPGIKINQSDAQGWTPLHYAAYMNYEDIVVRLLKAKCNRRSFDLSGRTPVDVAIERGYNLIASLIEADPYIVHIHDMCEVGKILLVLALLKQGCPPIYRDERIGKYSQTPLMAACQGNQIEVVRMLLRYNEVVEDVNAVDEKGMTALMKAAKVGALDITALLLNVGCDREVKDVKGMTARDYAASHSFSVMIQFMSQSMIR